MNNSKIYIEPLLKVYFNTVLKELNVFGDERKNKINRRSISLTSLFFPSIFAICIAYLSSTGLTLKRGWTTARVAENQGSQNIQNT